MLAVNKRVIKLESFRHDPHLLKNLISTYETQTKEVLAEINQMLEKKQFSEDSLKQKIHLLQGSTKYFYEGPLITQLDVFLSDPDSDKFKGLAESFSELMAELKASL
jgi:HPt (histidine-containing phosphotransfer) domain-containing protein